MNFKILSGPSASGESAAARRVRCVAALVLVMVTACARQDGASSEDARVGIAGEVIDASAMSPIAGAKILVEPWGNTTTSDAEGKFDFGWLVVGGTEECVSGRLTVTGDGYGRYRKDFSLRRGVPANFIVTMAPEDVEVPARFGCGMTPSTRTPGGSGPLPTAR